MSATPHTFVPLEGEASFQQGEFFQAGGLDFVPPVDWLVHGMVPRGDTTIFVGLPGSGKTSLMWEWAWYLAAGKEDWYKDRKRYNGKLNPTDGRVLYVMTEGFTQFRAHSRGIRIREGLSNGYYPENLFYRRDSWRLGEGKNKGLWLTQMASWLEGGPVQLLVLDTLNRTLPTDMDEDNNTDIGNYMDAFKEFRLAHEKLYPDAPSPTIWFAHHPPKGGDSPRGAGAIEGNTDVLIHVKKHKADDGTVLCSEVSNSRMKPYEEFKNFLFTMEWTETGEYYPGTDIPVKVPFVDTVDWETSYDAVEKELKTENAHERVAAYVRTHPGAFRIEIQEALSVSDGTIRKAVASGLVTTEKEGKAHRYYAT